MKKLVICLMALILTFSTLIACAPNQTASDIQRERQEKQVKEGAAQTGIPSIVNFREAKLAKMLYEQRDQAILTYTYLENMIPTPIPGKTALGGKFSFVCESVGYPLPYSVQFTAPEAVQTYNLTNTGGGQRYYGAERLPQPEPNGLYSPSSSEASWVMCKFPGQKDVIPFYIESRASVSQIKLPPD